VHFGAENVSALRVVKSFVAGANADAVVLTGDITQRGRTSEFAAAREWLEGVGVPALVTPGNHDTPLLHMPARMTSPFRRYRKHMAGFDIVDRVAELGGGAVRISAINTARGMQARRNWADGVVDMADLDAALSLLSIGRADAWRILLCHHPLVQPAISRIAVQTLRGAQALKRAETARVDAILTGHVHDAFAEPVPGVGRRMVQMGSGTLSTRLRSTSASFCVVDIAGDRLTQDVVSFDGDALSMKRTYESSHDGTASPPIRS
jgi:3',5'-cyclic AMP phosphodiesterase CpdA